ncbi:MAG: hypothetical protein JW719_05815 [Pirellulales bacterium]|nr:hypothetical protein [Pirellulales bacterium]
MFAITIGLLGIAALIPTGQFAVVQSTMADRSSACGRAGLAAVKADQIGVAGAAGQIEPRAMLDPAAWTAFAPSASAWQPFGPAGTPQVAADVGYGDAFVIDPLFVAWNLSNPDLPVVDQGRLAAFPYGETDPAALPWSPAYLDRLTFRDVADANPPVLPLSVAERMFRWADDRIFDIARGDADRRTRSTYVWSDSDATVTPYPVLPGETAPSGAPLRQANEGNYSWLLTVSPAPTEAIPAGAEGFRNYRVSVVVFFRRVLDYLPATSSEPATAERTPTERVARVVLTGGGYGGGDAAIYLPTDAGSSHFGMGADDEAAYDAYLKVRPDRWILLVGMSPDRRVPTDRFASKFGAAIDSNWRRVAQWYRVVMADDVQRRSEVPCVELAGVPGLGDAYYRRVTLAGPDWDPGALDATATPPTAGAAAVLVDGVIGVYTKEIRLAK